MSSIAQSVPSVRHWSLRSQNIADKSSNRFPWLDGGILRRNSVSSHIQRIVSFFSLVRFHFQFFLLHIVLRVGAAVSWKYIKGINMKKKISCQLPFLYQVIFPPLKDPSSKISRLEPWCYDVLFAENTSIITATSATVCCMFLSPWFMHGSSPLNIFLSQMTRWYML